MDSYTIEEIEEMLKGLNIDRLEFSNRDIIVFTRQSKAEVDKFFIKYEEKRLFVFSKLLEDFYKNVGENV
jgi:hypothetical protein